MVFECHHMDKFGFANLDYIDEIQEKENKAVVLIAGASSSGKSYAASFLNKLLSNYHHHPLTLSLDSYNVGLSGIIPNKVNLNFFNNSIENISEISAKIKKIIYNVPFENKFSDNVLKQIEIGIKDLIDEKDLKKFIEGLKAEWNRVNFDEPSVYNMKEAYEDILKLLENKKIKEKKYSKVYSERLPMKKTIDGNKYDVIIIEGIYALDNSFIDLFKQSNKSIITNFVDGDAKSLFLRRVIRDKRFTSANSIFTIQLYFKYILKAYYETILPSRENADIILNNDMTFIELTNGELYLTKDEISTEDKNIYSYLKKFGQIKETIYQKDIYFVTKNENESKYKNNILRFRLISDDEGKTYHPSSLVHKGNIKLRKDNKIIRPINILLSEEEIGKVWKDEQSCINDFIYAGFIVGKIEKKIKTKLVYNSQAITLKEFEGVGSYIEFNTPYNYKTIQSIKKMIENKEYKQ